jgi:hypothetical protein
MDGFGFDRDTKAEKISESEWRIDLKDYTLPVGESIVNGIYFIDDH